MNPPDRPEEIDGEEVDPELKEKTVTPRLMFTEEQKKDLRDAFNLLDYTGEGKIKAEDFRVVIKALGYEPTKEELQHMINGVDKNQSGKLSFENFETAIMRKIMSQDNDVDIMKSFRLFDNDDCGFISADNVKRVSELLKFHLTDEEIEELMDDADKDFDGLLSVHEFMRMIKTSVHIETP
ncbi:uncharacterized protein [Battus philenor]|uniref:uncharacterized protein n=1 Tax=Battus philenor TaxID=42288 RepID=UPI0035CFC78D